MFVSPYPATSPPQRASSATQSPQRLRWGVKGEVAAHDGVLASLRAAASGMRARTTRKPIAWLASVFLFLGMGFGVNVWAVCDKELEDSIQTELAHRFSDNMNSVDAAKFGMNMRRALEEQSRRPYVFGSVEKDRDGVSSTKKLIANYSVSQSGEAKAFKASLLLTLCILERNLGRAPQVSSQKEIASSTPNGAPVPAKSPKELQREREAQARVDAAQAKQRAIDARVEAEKAKQNALDAQARTAAEQAQQRGRDVQAQADAAAQREGRRSHDPAAQAHQCLEPDFKTLNGGFKNKCSYAVSYGYCVENPRPGALTSSPLFNCAGMRPNFAGGQSIKANGYDANHTRGGTGVQFFACRQPAYALDLVYVVGKGLEGRCRNI